MLEKIPFLGRGIEERRQNEQVQEERNFAREQNVFQNQSNDDQSYFVSQESKSDLLRWQQDLDDEIIIVVEHLLGKRKTNNGWEQMSGTKPLCNEKFITEVLIPQCKPFLTRSLINSNWNERMILTRLKITSNTIASSIADRYDEYDIEFTNFDTVLNEIKTIIIAGAYRALNGWTKRIDSTMIKRVESMSEQAQQPQTRKGILGVFKSA